MQILRNRHTVIFDVEGTLIDCAWAILPSWHEVLAGFDMEVSCSRLQDLSGRDTGEMLAELLPQTSAFVRRCIADEQGRHYRAKYLDRVISVAGAADTLVDLRRAGKRIAMATSCQRDELDHYLDVAGCRDFVDYAACGDDARCGKPHADLLELALAGLQEPASAAVAVGDTPYDARAGAEVGVPVIGVLTGGFSPSALKAAGCVEVVCSVSSLRSHDRRRLA